MTRTADKPSFVYVTYIHSTPEKVWEALTDADLTAQYWGHSNVSDWQPGSRWEHLRTDGSGIADVEGEVIESAPPRLLVITFGGADEAGQPSVVRFDIEPHHDIVRLTVTHDRHPHRVGLRGRVGGLGSGHVESEVAAGNRARAAAGAVGDARGTARRADVAKRVIWHHAAPDHVPRRRFRSRGGARDRTRLPRGIREGVSWGRPVFCVAEDVRDVRRQHERRYQGRDYIQYPHSILVKVDDSDRKALERDKRFFYPAYWARQVGSAWTSPRPRRSTGTRCANWSTRRTGWSHPRSSSGSSTKLMRAPSTWFDRDHELRKPVPRRRNPERQRLRVPVRQTSTTPTPTGSRWSIRRPVTKHTLPRDGCANRCVRRCTRRPRYRRRRRGRLAGAEQHCVRDRLPRHPARRRDGHHDQCVVHREGHRQAADGLEGQDVGHRQPLLPQAKEAAAAVGLADDHLVVLDGGAGADGHPNAADLLECGPRRRRRSASTRRHTWPCCPTAPARPAIPRA